MPRSLGLVAAVLLAASLVAPAARAADLYLSANLVQAVGTDGASGQIEGDTFAITGSDSDSSIGYGIAPGFGFKFAEVLPEGWRAWDSGFRVEAEFTYGREFDVVSDLETGPNPGPAGRSTDLKFFDEVKIWTAMPVIWLDLPLRKPLSKMFGRVPILDPLTLSTGFGAGIAHVHINAFDNTSRGIDSVYKFSWQANLALSYSLTDRTTVQFGYRYLDFGATDAQLRFSSGVSAGSINLDLSSHEFSAVMRWNYFSRPLEDMSPTKWHLPKWGKPKRPKWTHWHRPRWLGGHQGP